MRFIFLLNPYMIIEIIILNTLFAFAISKVLRPKIAKIFKIFLLIPPLAWIWGLVEGSVLMYKTCKCIFGEYFKD